MFSINDIALVELNLIKCNFSIVDESIKNIEASVTLGFNVKADFDCESGFIYFDVSIDVNVSKVNDSGQESTSKDDVIVSFESEYNAMFEYYGSESFEREGSSEYKHVVINNVMNIIYPSLRSDIVYLLSKTSFVGIDIPLSFPHNK